MIWFVLVAYVFVVEFRLAHFHRALEIMLEVLEEQVQALEEHVRS